VKRLRTSNKQSKGEMDMSSSVTVGAQAPESGLIDGFVFDAPLFIARIIFNSSTGWLYHDADGEVGDGAVQFAVLPGEPSLTNADFFVVS
jgi:hypothetical protein